MAELEVPARRARRRHDLRSLDADPEAAPDRRRANLDRRLAGRRSHRRWRPLRRRRGGSQGETPPGAQGARACPGGARDHRRRGRGRRGSAWKAAKAPPGGRQRATGRDPGHRRPAGTGRQAGKGCRDRRASQTAAATAVRRHGGRARRGSCREPGTSIGGCASTASSRTECSCERARRHRRGHPPPPPAQALLSRYFQRLQVLDHPAGELGRGRGAACHADLLGAGEPGQVQVFELVHEVGRLLAQLLDDLDQA